MGGLLLLNLQNVIAELRLDQIRGLPRSEREGNLVELGNGAAAVEPSKLAALRLAARVVGVLAGKIGEVCAALDLLQEIVGLGFSGRVGLRIGPCRNSDQNVTNFDLLLHLVLSLVLVVVGLNIGIGDLRLAARQVRGVEGDVLNLAGLRNRIRVVGCVVLEELLKLGIGRIDRLAKIVAEMTA